MKCKRNYVTNRTVSSFIKAIVLAVLATPAVAAIQTDKNTLAQPDSAGHEYICLPEKFFGFASWYGGKFHGRKTASGETYDMNMLTAAHRRLPLPTRLLIKNPRNGKTIVVRVNDRGPYIKNRIIDLSREAAKQLGTLTLGVVYVECMILPPELVGTMASQSSPVSPAVTTISDTNCLESKPSNLILLSTGKTPAINDAYNNQIADH